MQDISRLSGAVIEEIAGYIKKANLESVNQNSDDAKVRNSFYTRYGKRMIDVLAGCIGFTISLPFNLVIAIVTFFDVGRPIIFRQKRLGKDEKEFTLVKFRNMTNEKDAHGELLPPEERVTKWGKFVRKTSLDELLNFWSIIKGDMSLIGPRPLHVFYCDRLCDRHKSIYKVRPGLECPSLHDTGHATTWTERLDNYVWYAENCSFLLDIRMIFRIIWLALDRKNTKARGDATTGELLGYDTDGSIIDSKNVPDRFVAEYCNAHGFTDLEDAIKSGDTEKSTADLVGLEAAATVQETISV